jgi:MarR family transcriptional regulator, organic hydroperoxide resistance regulator
MDHQPTAGVFSVDRPGGDEGHSDPIATKADLSRALVTAFGLSPLQARSLRHLDNPMTMRELADAIGTEPSNLTPVVDRLEAAGLVQRRPHPGDRRIKEIYLTTDGNRIRQRLVDEVYGTMAIFDRLTRSQQAQLLRLLDKLATG